MNVITDISLNNELGIVILEDSKAAHDDIFLDPRFVIGNGNESSFEGSLLVSKAFDVLIFRYGLWRVLLMFTSIWCDGSRPDLLYVLEFLTRSYRKVLGRNARRRLCSENVCIAFGKAIKMRVRWLNVDVM